MEPIDPEEIDLVKPGSPREATDDERAVLAARLEDFITGYLEIGEKLGVEVEPEAVLGSVDRALAHAESRPWQGVEAPDEVERQFLHDLYEELTQEREGLYDHWFDERGGEHFAPIGDEEWRRVLLLLHARLAKTLED